MTEKIQNPTGNDKYVPLMITFEQLMAMKAQQDQAGRQAPAAQRNGAANNPRYNQVLAGPNLSRDGLRPIDDGGARKKRRKRLSTVVSIGTVAALGVGGYSLNLGGSQQFVQSMLHNGSGDQAHANGLVMDRIVTNGQNGFVPGYCDTPNAVVMVVTVNGYMDLIPRLSQTGSDGKVVTGLVNPYMAVDKKPTVGTPENIAIFEANIKTDGVTDGYQHADFVSMPLAATLCEPLNSGAIYEAPDGYTVHRELLDVYFNDPGKMLNTDMNIVSQVKGTSGYAKLDVNKRQYMSVPDRILLSNGTDNAGKVTDAVLNKSYTDLTKNLNSQSEENLIKSLMEESIIQQIHNPSGMPKTVTTPNNDNILQNELDSVLVKKLIGDTNKKITWAGNYHPKAYVPFDSITKTLITANAKKNLINLDPNQPFHITHADITFGSINELKSTIPSPTIPTPTPTTSTAP
jgi:hypothetical protein